MEGQLILQMYLIFLNVNEVDGILIGGASLNPKDFLAIYHSTS